MKRTMGEILRELRKNHNMTQEQTAELLGVSFQSVSRWENDLSSPDISLIPVIARLYNVTTDTLFDMELHNQAYGKEQYEETFKEHRRNGNLPACRDTMQEALEYYPREHHFMMHLADTLYLFASGTSAQRMEYAEMKYANRIRSLCEFVLDDCTKEKERIRAIHLLSRYYADAGNIEKALQLIDTLPDLKYCRDVLRGEILTGDEKIHQLQQTVLSAVDYAATTLVNMAFRKEYGIASTLSIDERIAYVDTANKLYAVLIADGNYQFYHRIIGWNHRRLAELHLVKGNQDIAFEHLKEAEMHAVRYDTLKDSRYTALLVNTLSYEPSDYYKTWEGSEQAMLLYRLNELKEYFVNHADYSAMKQRLEKVTENELSISIE